jgi:hypothetical protein
MKKALRSVIGMLSLVDYMIEPLARRSQISNLGLLRDLKEVIIAFTSLREKNFRNQVSLK